MFVSILIDNHILYKRFKRTNMPGFSDRNVSHLLQLLFLSIDSMCRFNTPIEFRDLLTVCTNKNDVSVLLLL